MLSLEIMTEEQIEVWKENLYAVLWFLIMNWMAVVSLLFVVLIHLETFN
jgi:hypothetical protein